MDKLQQLIAKKQKLDKCKPLPLDLIKNLDQWYKIELTYNSNAIEGNTLTKQETALVVEKGLTVEGKTLQEHLEATNHAKAIDFVKNLILSKKTRQDISENDILEIHKIILTGIDDHNAGKYRNIAVRISGADVILPNPMKVPELMTDFIQWLNQKNNDHPAKISADAHLKLVSIHPFTDGNGRTARLLMNLILMQTGFPLAIIQNKNRKQYINALEKAQTKNETDDYYDLIYGAVDNSLDVYLDSVKK